MILNDPKWFYMILNDFCWLTLKLCSTAMFSSINAWSFHSDVFVRVFSPIFMATGWDFKKFHELQSTSKIFKVNLPFLQEKSQFLLRVHYEEIWTKYQEDVCGGSHREGEPLVGSAKRWLNRVDEVLKRKRRSLAQEESEIYEDRNNWRDIVRCSPTGR